MPTVVVNVQRGGRLPFQVYFLLLITISGIPMMIGVPTSEVVEAVGHPESNIWGSFLFIGGASNLLGIYWPKNTVTGMVIERSGLIALGGASFIWSVLVLWKVHIGGLFSASLTLGLCLACIAQYRYINGQMKKIMEAIDRHD